QAGDHLLTHVAALRGRVIFGDQARLVEQVVLGDVAAVPGTAVLDAQDVESAFADRDGAARDQRCAYLRRLFGRRVDGPAAGGEVGRTDDPHRGPADDGGEVALAGRVRRHRRAGPSQRL